MSSPTFFTDGSTPRANASRWTVLQKILGATLDSGGGGGGGGGGSVLTGVGAPSGAPAVSPAIYLATDTDALYAWDGTRWVTLIAP